MIKMLANLKQKLTSRKWLVDDWRDLRSWWSIRINAVGFAVSVIKAGMIAASYGSGFFGRMRPAAAWIIIGILFAAGMVARILNQGK